MLDFEFSTAISGQLKTKGADPRLLYSSMEKFSLEESVQDFKPQAQAYKTTKVSAQQQLDFFHDFLEDPHDGSPVVCISSFPTDARAKIAALHVFRNAMVAKEGTVRKPVWVTLYGDRFNYEELKNKRPSMLFISNIVLESTAYKMERLRDILEMFPDIPRVVVTGGTVDPTELFVRRLHLPINAALSIGPKHVVSNLLELMESSLI